MRAEGMIALCLLAFACGVPDEDKDGLSRDVDCDDRDASVGEGATWYYDGDGDGIGIEEDTLVGCTVPEGYVELAGDCNDDNPSVRPGVPETCNQVDDNCDGQVDEAGATEVWYADLDGDGFGDRNVSFQTCTQGAGTVADASDCDDSDADVNPLGTEVCDGKDDDCDGQVDESAEDAVQFWRDDDGDGVGGAGTVFACTAPAGYADATGDCNDADAAAFPGNSETCDGVDNDCDGAVDEDATDAATWYADADGDAFGDPDSPIAACTQPAGAVADNTDCDDGAAEVNPETFWYVDSDGDSFGVAGASAVQACARPAGTVLDAGDCDDANDEIYPWHAESCDGVDEDCDGVADEGATDAPSWYVDGDGDGYGADDVAIESCSAPSPEWIDQGGDCDDARAEVSPGEDEVCDEQDNDCDGLVDISDPSLIEVPRWYPDADEDGFGVFTGSVEACIAPDGFVLDGADCDDADEDIRPDAVEVCDGVDNDCDGRTDGDDAVDAVASYVDSDGDGWGDIATEIFDCFVPSGRIDVGEDCDDADPLVYPLAPEACDAGRDLNCDGSFGFADADGDGFAACEECDDSEPGSYPGATEDCDGVDNDCNGIVDDDGAGGFPWRYYYDGDGDSYGLSYDYLTWCEAGRPPGYVASSGDCDDSDPLIFPFAVERCNLEDDDCDGVIPAWEIDDDGDGYGPLACGGDDCDDTAPDVNPGEIEVCDDGVDNDCDGFIDGADPDVATRLSTSDDSTHAISWGFPFDYCGSTYTNAWVTSNGRMTFYGADSDYSESTSEMQGERGIAGLWDDLYPSGAANGDVYWISYPDAFGVYWESVAELSGTSDNTFSIILLADGRIQVDINQVQMSDGLSGWSCGAGGSAVTTDLSALSAPVDARGFGTGTETQMYQYFASGNDLDQLTFMYCATAGDDLDGDGWTDVCGDLDDTDPAVHP